MTLFAHSVHGAVRVKDKIEKLSYHSLIECAHHRLREWVTLDRTSDAYSLLRFG